MRNVAKFRENLILQQFKVIQVSEWAVFYVPANTV